MYSETTSANGNEPEYDKYVGVKSCDHLLDIFYPLASDLCWQPKLEYSTVTTR
jgi:hypothetical protein